MPKRAARVRRKIKQRFSDYALNETEAGGEFLLQATLKPEAERRIQDSPCSRIF